MASEISFPWEMFMQAEQAKNQNRRNMYQDIAGLGQGLGEGFNTIGQSMQEAKKKQLLQQIVQAMQQKGQPIPGPQGYTPPGSTGTAPAGQPIDNSNQINALMMQYDPQTAMQKMSQKPVSPWRVVPGPLTPDGNPIQQNEITGEVRVLPIKVMPTGRGNANFGTGSVSWDTATEEDKNIGKGLYEGRIRPFDLGYRDRTVGTKLANEYALKNGLPPFKSYAGDVASGTAKAHAFGKFGQNENSLNTALGHVNSAYDAYQAIGNTNEAWLNAPLNKIRKSTNDPNIVKLGVTLNALRGELANVFKNSGGTDQEISSWREYLNENLTPSQISAAIPQIDELLRSRLSALEYQRQSGMGGRAETPLLSPHASEISKRLGGGTKKQATKIGRFEVEVQP